MLGTPEAFAAVEDGRVVPAGTYHGNPLVAAGVLATLEVLAGSDYAAMLARGERLRRTLVEAFAAHGVAVSTSGFGSVFSLWFAPAPPADYAAAKALVRPELSLALHSALRREGVVVLPSARGRLFLSFAHGEDELASTERAFRAAAEELARSRPTGTRHGRGG